MSHHKFDPKCPDCRPVIIDQKTGQVMPPNSPIMVAMNAVWEASSREDQEAFHRVTVLNGRNPADLIRMKQMSDRLEAMMGN